MRKDIYNRLCHHIGYIIKNGTARKNIREVPPCGYCQNEILAEIT